MPQWFTRPNLPFPLEGNAAKRQRVYEAERRYETPLPICPPNGGLLYLSASSRFLPTPSTAHAVPLPLQAGGRQVFMHVALFAPMGNMSLDSHRGKGVAQPPKGEAPEWCRNRMVSTLFVPLLFFHLYPIKIAFSQKFRLPVGIFLIFRKISCM